MTSFTSSIWSLDLKTGFLFSTYKILPLYFLISPAEYPDANVMPATVLLSVVSGVTVTLLIDPVIALAPLNSTNLSLLVPVCSALMYSF